MRYGSVCSGIEAATVAWHPLSWQPIWFSEIEPFPCKVLACRYPGVPNLGNMLYLNQNEIYNNETIDLLVGGTPCQSFSIAGLRGGLADSRGNLALEYCRILRAKQPRWFIWENVPGVLSSSKGLDFRSILSGFQECGYSFAWRILDAQYFGVPQRRRRVFVVGYLGNDWRPSATVLFEPQGLRGSITQGGKKRKKTAAAITRRPYSDNQSREDNLIAKPLNASAYRDDYDTENFITNTLTANGHDASEDGTGRGVPIVFQHKQSSAGSMNPAEVCPTLHKGKNPSVLYTLHGSDGTISTASEAEIACSLKARAPGGIENSSTSIVQTGPIVRRLTPMECERLQGFPDQYTGIKGAKNSPRYAAIGNSMAVPVMAWIGRRINHIDKQIRK